MPTPETRASLSRPGVTLGALLGGALRLVLCAYLTDYRSRRRPIPSRPGTSSSTSSRIPTPSGSIRSSPMRKKAELLAPQQPAMGLTVRSRRNAIHAFRDRDIGSFAEFPAVRYLRTLLLTLSAGMPYPDSHYAPCERAPRLTRRDRSGVPVDGSPRDRERPCRTCVGASRGHGGQVLRMRGGGDQQIRRIVFPETPRRRRRRFRLSRCHLAAAWRTPQPALRGPCCR